ncbi:MAG: DUF502 domain-containing protein [Simkaniaceae bacterium]|nr:DUF502 domain-containing protein [Simkaniaceae bacterium]
MKKTFWTGVAILLPFAVTIFIVIFLFDFLSSPFVGYVEKILMHFLPPTDLPQTYHRLFDFIGRVLSLVSLFFLILLLGFIARRFFFKWIITGFQKMLSKIPYVKRIYKIVDQVTSSFIPAEKKQIFKNTVLVKFPHEEAHALGLLSGDAPGVVQKILEKEEIETVFVPTAPHPISGFLIMTDKANVKRIDATTEDLFKFLFSCGIVDPGSQNDKS